ncbi:peptidase associated/transthyretin-like domain-containing protein [Taibaiella helva]|uniref:hypothetical protein n=1 Tax=Taibaiella helva TaxID=2301235 RepID=UPI000E56955F|nr:hypothetical protein [Taibaiella helva]
MRFLFLFLWLPGAVGLRAQQLYGVVVDAATGTPLPAVGIDNDRSGEHILSSEKGTYSIAVKSGDRVRFKLLGYTVREFLVGSGEAEQYQRIPLEKYLQHIDTVVVRPGLSDYQRDSLEYRRLFGKKVAQERVRFGLNKRGPPGGFGLVFNNPISAPYQRFARKYKRLRAFQRRFKAQEKQSFIDTRYTPDEVHALTGLTGDTLAAFMNTYPMPYDYARTASDLEISMWIRSNYRQWSGREAVKSRGE